MDHELYCRVFQILFNNQWSIQTLEKWRPYFSKRWYDCRMIFMLFLQYWWLGKIARCNHQRATVNHMKRIHGPTTWHGIWHLCVRPCTSCCSYHVVGAVGRWLFCSDASNPPVIDNMYMLSEVEQYPRMRNSFASWPHPLRRTHASSHRSSHAEDHYQIFHLIVTHKKYSESCDI